MWALIAANVAAPTIARITEFAQMHSAAIVMMAGPELPVKLQFACLTAQAMASAVSLAHVSVFLDGLVAIARFRFLLYFKAHQSRLRHTPLTPIHLLLSRMW
jgi:hypothetical protein